MTATRCSSGSVSTAPHSHARSTWRSSSASSNRFVGRLGEQQLAPVATQLHQADVVGNRPQPGTERGGVAQLGDPAQRDDAGVLDGVIRAVGAELRHRHRPQARAVAREEQPERGGVARLR
ncbi:MAG TPA: hypothetical protein VH418_02485 [Solirubrobacteraceae bacterium]|jgi:hypothetical protein